MVKKPSIIATHDFIEYNLKNIDWSVFYKTHLLSEDILEKYIDYVPFRSDILRYQHISCDLIERHFEKFKTETLFEYNKLSTTILDKLDSSENLDWFVLIKKYCLLDVRLMDRFSNKVSDWTSLGSNISSDVILKYGEKLNMYKLSQCSNLNIECLIKFKDKVDWVSVCRRLDNLSDNVIRQVADYIDWDTVTFKYTIEDDIIEDFKDKVNWDIISKRYILDEAFVTKYKDRLNINMIKRRYDIGFNNTNKYEQIIDSANKK